VLLKPLQDRNQALAVRKQIVSVAGFQADSAQQVEALFRQHIETRIVDLDSGKFDDSVDPASFDPRAASRDPATSRALAPNEDPARIQRRPNLAPVYLVRDGERIKTVVLPVFGYGLWSTMHGLIALAGDGRTVSGLTFYEHGETPGLGDFIESPKWQAQFPGRLAFDEQGKLRLAVVRGGVNPASPEARYQVDAVAGATLTSNGVNNLLRYWLGEQGFGPFLERLRANGEMS
jgi:Na+-transporting NADH:ubiquinone oxidoreductase subunit C